MSKSPYVAAALFCEKFLQEQDGVISLIRVVDRISAAGVVPPGASAASVPLTMYVGLKSGDLRGPAKLRVECVSPSGKKTPLLAEIDVELEGDNKGYNVLLHGIALDAQEFGIYWFDVFCNDVRLTRAPLELILTSSPPSSDSPN